MAHPEALGWMSRLLTVLNKATRETFDGSYPVEDFAGEDKLWVGTEFPLAESQYPGIWIDFDPTGELQTVGIGHKETIEVDHVVHPIRRWRFSGYATFTVATLSNFQRARLLDEVVKVMAFGDMDDARNTFRSIIQENDYLGMNFDFDQVGIVGKSEITPTPWGSDDVIYEISARMECIGEFLSDVSTQELVPISAINVYPFSDQEPDPGDSPPLSEDDGDWR